MSSLKKVAIKGFSWIFGATIFQKLLSFASLIVLARQLSPEEFGVVAIALVFIGYFEIFTVSGVGSAIVQKPFLSQKDIETAVSLSILFSLVLFVIILYSSEVIAQFFSLPELETVIVVLSFSLPLVAFKVVGLNLLKRNLQYKEVSLLELASFSVATVCVTIPMAIFGKGLWSLVYGHLAKELLMLILIQLKVSESRVLGFSWPSAKALLNFGFGQTLGRVANVTANQADNLVVGKALGAEAAGFYSRAYSLMMIPAGIFGTVMDKTLFPIMSSIQSETTRLSNAYLLCVSCVAMLSFPLTVVLILAADDIVRVIMGEGWEQVVLIFQILSSVLIFRMSYKISDSLSRAKGTVYRRAFRQGVYALCVIGGAYFGSQFGLLGVAVGVCIAITLNFILMLHLSQSILGFSWLDFAGVHLKHLLFALVMAAVLIPIKLLISQVTELPVLKLIYFMGASAIVLFSVLWTVKSKLKAEFSLIKRA